MRPPVAQIHTAITHTPHAHTHTQHASTCVYRGHDSMSLLNCLPHTHTHTHAGICRGPEKKGSAQQEIIRLTVAGNDVMLYIDLHSTGSGYQCMHRPLIITYPSDLLSLSFSFSCCVPPCRRCCLRRRSGLDSSRSAWPSWRGRINS